MEKNFNLFLADSAVYLNFLREWHKNREFKDYLKNFDSFVISLDSTLTEIKNYFSLNKQQVKPSRKFSALLKGWDDVDNRRRLLITAGAEFTRELEHLENAVTSADSYSLPSQRLRERLKDCRVGLYSWQ
jgi:hypothetical protein